MPTVNTAVMDIALAEFAKAHNPDGKKIIVLMIDGAGWHTTKKLQIPEGIRFVQLPSHTPQLQPVESAWPPLKEPMANRAFDSIAEVEEVLTKRCQYLTANPDILKGQVGFEWVAKLG